ncbi:MAG: hypothetical protein AB8F78_11360 [Saprospiraceae bacterium]
MKALTFFLSLLIVAGVNYEATAQYSRNSNNGGGGYTASSNSNSRNSSNYYRNSNRNLTRVERRRFQNDLVRTADELYNWEYRLERRSAALDGRGIRTSRRDNRPQRPYGLLSTRELRSWEARLDRKANRLETFERDILRAERRRGNNRGGNRGGGRNNGGGTRGGGNSGGGNGGGTYCPPGWG